MTDRPIMFTPAMVRALREGLKTQTRRKAIGRSGKPTVWTKATPGDRLWVREPHRLDGDAVVYRSDGEAGEGRWRPALHMPRWASRMTLLVEDVRRETAQAISGADAAAEGMAVRGAGDAQLHFKDQWIKMHGEDAWAKDVEVIVLGFSVVGQNIDAL